jgi:alkaline phosphatase D
MLHRHPFTTALPFCLVLCLGLFFDRAGSDEPVARAVGGNRIDFGLSPEFSRLYFGSCANQLQPIPILGQVAREKPDLFIFMGDNIYGDTEDMKVLSDQYQLLAANRDFQSLQKTCPVLATWDDHDYGVNDGGADYKKRAESEKIFLDFWKVKSTSPRRTRPGVYDVQYFGSPASRIQVILLDTRYFRGPLKKGVRRVGGPYYPDEDPSISMLGKRQWDWLSRTLKEPAKLRIIVSSIQFLAGSAGQETWSNLPMERARFMELLDSLQVDNALFISGDRHWSELSALKRASGLPLYDLTSSSLNRPHQRGTPTKNAFRVIEKTYHEENYGRILIDWKQQDPELTLQICNLTGEVMLGKKLHLGDLARP